MFIDFICLLFHILHQLQTGPELTSTLWSKCVNNVREIFGIVNNGRVIIAL